MRFVEHRVSDRRVRRHIKKWLNAGVLEEGEWRQVEEGVPQGSSIGPLLANIYLHYAFDLWAQNWRRRQTNGDVVLVRFADDIVGGFQYRSDAERFLAEFRARLAKFGLELHPDKTRLIEFGRFAVENRRRRGEGKPETFDFLDFTHSSDQDEGKFIVLRQTKKRRMRRKLKEVKAQLRRRLHDPIEEVGAYLRSVVTGHFRYYGVPRNGPALTSFRHAVLWLWWRSLQRRSQRHRSRRKLRRRFKRWVSLFIPSAHILQPYPEQRLRVITQGRSPVRQPRSLGSVEGAVGNHGPYSDRLELHVVHEREHGLAAQLEASGDAHLEPDECPTAAEDATPGAVVLVGRHVVLRAPVLFVVAHPGGGRGAEAQVQAGAVFTALSFCNAEEVAYLEDIEKLTRVPLTPVADHAYHAPAIAALRGNGVWGVRDGW